MLHLHAQQAAVLVQPGKPILNTGKKGDAAAAVVQALPGQRQAHGLAPADHGVHVGQYAVHVFAPAEVVGLLPEVAGGHAQAGDKGVILHILGT